jgi:hypothetical protein
VDRRIAFFVEHDLRNARTVADVNKNKVAKIAAAVHPSHEHSSLAGIGSAKSATAVGALQVA